MLRFLLPLLLSLHSLAFAGHKEEALAILGSFRAEPDFLTRLEQVSRTFLGRPYGHTGPLGEGPDGKYDQDPLYRFDAFDCTTFVETVVSLAASRTLPEFERTMDHIRYEDGVVDYLRRNHFTDLQWVPANTKSGLLREINHLVVEPAQLREATAIIDLPAWLRRKTIDDVSMANVGFERRLQILRELRSEGSAFSKSTAKISYIPVATLLEKPELLNRIPTGTVVNFIRPDWDLTASKGTRLNVSHQGLLFRKAGGLVLRHAGSTEGAVVELAFLEYLSRFRDHETLKGVHLMQVNR